MLCVPCPVVAPCPGGGVDEPEGFGDAEFDTEGDGLELDASTTKIVIAEPCASGEPVGGLVK